MCRGRTHLLDAPETRCVQHALANTRTMEPPPRWLGFRQREREGEQAGEIERDRDREIERARERARTREIARERERARERVSVRERERE